MHTAALPTNAAICRGWYHQPVARDKARFEESDIQVQFEKLRTIKDGWLDGVGSSIDVDLLRRVRTWLGDHVRDSIPRPTLFPTPEGGVEVEWVAGRYDVSVEFDPVSGKVAWHALDLDTCEVDEMDVSMDDEDGLRNLGKHLASVLARTSSSSERS